VTVTRKTRGREADIHTPTCWLHSVTVTSIELEHAQLAGLRVALCCHLHLLGRALSYREPPLLAGAPPFQKCMFQSTSEEMGACGSLILVSVCLDRPAWYRREVLPSNFAPLASHTAFLKPGMRPRGQRHKLYQCSSVVRYWDIRMKRKHLHAEHTYSVK